MGIPLASIGHRSTSDPAPKLPRGVSQLESEVPSHTQTVYPYWGNREFPWFRVPFKVFVVTPQYQCGVHGSGVQVERSGSRG